MMQRFMDWLSEEANGWKVLGYIIFAANEETRAARTRAGLSSGDEANMPSCN